MVGGVIESTPLSHRHRLRAATADAHGRVDVLAADATRSADGYAAYLRGMHRFLSEGEQALRDDASAAGLGVRRRWLERDLDAIIIGTGLINFNIYSSLKSWIVAPDVASAPNRIAARKMPIGEPRPRRATAMPVKP